MSQTKYKSNPIMTTCLNAHLSERSFLHETLSINYQCQIWYYQIWYYQCQIWRTLFKKGLQLRRPARKHPVRWGRQNYRWASKQISAETCAKTFSNFCNRQYNRNETFPHIFLPSSFHFHLLFDTLGCNKTFIFCGNQ